ncbi:MAG: MarR family transcriptional regulator [Pantoea sp.]|uniref:MarR family winged helix-turn-helix transcriptional regulator n=1 Tax=Pantoea sp. TaxID=69393 RepID=UPI0039E5AB73
MQVYLLLSMFIVMNTSPDEIPAIDIVITELSLAVGQLLRRLRSETNIDGLSWSQTSVLAWLDRDGSMTTAELARKEAVRPQSMGATLAELTERGFITRHPHPTDGRQILFSLTAAGLEARHQRTAAKQAWLLTAMTELNPAELRTLREASELLRRISGSSE